MFEPESVEESVSAQSRKSVNRASSEDIRGVVGRTCIIFSFESPHAEKMTGMISDS